MRLYIDLCMDDKSEKEKCKAFLYVIGPAGRDIFTALVLKDDEKDKIDVLFKKFEEYCKPKKNVTVQRYKFNTRCQGASESVDQYVTALRLAARTCN